MAETILTSTTGRSAPVFESPHRRGLPVLEADNGQAHSPRSRQSIPACVARHLMPEIDGIELLRQIEERHPGTSVIVIWGTATSDRRAHPVGAVISRKLSLEACSRGARPGTEAHAGSATTPRPLRRFPGQHRTSPALARTCVVKGGLQQTRTGRS
jgi:CheY-like chemotaxis protein